MAKLEIAEEEHSLVHGNEGERLEDHHSDGATRKNVTNNQFGEDLETDLLVSNSLHHTHGHDEEYCSDEGEREGPNRASKTSTVMSAITNAAIPRLPYHHMGTSG